VLGQDVPLGLDVLSDIISDSLFDPKEVRREKGVILQEIAAVADTPDDLVHDVFSEIAFADQPIGLRILGTSKTVRSLDADRLRGFLAREYSADRMIVAAAGAVDHDMIVREAEARLSVFRTVETAQRTPATYTGGEKRIGQRLEQSHVLLGFAAPSHQEPGFYPAQIFSSAMGGGMSSRLFQEVREKRGLCYAVHTFGWAYSDAGIFGVYFGAGEKTTGEAMDVTLDCLAAGAEDLTDEEVGRAKAQLKVSLLMAMESSSARADQMARHLLTYGRLIPSAEIIARVDAITTAEIRAMGRHLLSSRPTLTAIGPVRKLPGIDAIAARLAPAKAAA
jgi:predicted Zn-dependent peptidase